MKILMIGTGSPAIPPTYGGAEKVIYELSRALTTLGHEVHIVDAASNLERDTSLDIDDLVFYRVNYPILYPLFSKKIGNISIRRMLKHMTWLPFCFFASFKLLFLLRNDEFDIVHTHLRYPTLTTFIVKTILCRNVPIIFTVHTSSWTMENVSLKTKFAMLPEYFAFKFSSRIIALNETQKKGINKYSGVNEDKIVVISNGVNSNTFSPQKSENIENECKTIVCVGAIMGYKNQLTLVKAFSIVEKEFNLKLQLIGPAIDKYAKEIADYCVKEGMGNKVEITGRIPLIDMISSVQKANIVVIPSLQETNPLVLLEAMSCGKAIIASDLPNLEEMAKNGEVLFTEPTAEGIAETIIKVLGDKNLKRRLEKSSRELVLKKYSWEKIAEKYLKAYGEVMVK